jgi:chromosome segregation protein
VFLRSLTLRGFKSFADRTTLEFTPGVSVIVGPNGSGKSNIADAIAWVLGEQGARALRGSQMTDVIFAGSPSRPALGLAEVKLVIDNSAGLIPVPASEIEISRAVFRSGEAEYRLGGRPCRLIDILELLSDSGVGRALHTIVGQGHLEDVLAARPEDRRQFIEEAAGIAKHRRRRERAERKFAGMEQDLLRLQDLLAELRRQLKPLKQQAELAMRHEALEKEAENLALKLAAARLRELYRDRERRRPSWKEAENRQAEGRERLGVLDAQIAALDADRVRNEAEAAAAEEAHERAGASKSAAEERLRTAIRQESLARERLATAASGSGRLFALEDELERTEAALEEVRTSLERSETEAEEAERSFRRSEAARRDAEDERRRLAEEGTRRLIETESLGRTLAGHEAELARLVPVHRDLVHRRREAEANASRLEAEIERLDSTETPLAERTAVLDRERAELTTALADLDASEKGLLARHDVIEARRAELAESPGAGFARRRSGRAMGLLRDLLGTPPHLGVAVRAALGAFADAVVYPDRDGAVSDASSDSHGVVLLVAGAETPLVATAIPIPDGGTDDRALVDALRPDARIAAVAAALLGRSYLVRNLAEAAAKHRLYPWAEFVTPEGHVVGPAFVRTAAGHDVQLERIMREAGALERELGSVRRGLREARQRIGEVTAEAEAVRAALDAADTEITTAAEEKSDVDAELASVLREEQMVADRLAAVEAQAATARERLSAAAPPPDVPSPLPPVPEPPVNLRVEVEALRRDRTRMEAAVVRIRREIEALGADDPVALRSVLQEAEAERAAAEAALRDAEEHLRSALAAHRDRAEALREVQGRHSEANRAWREQMAATEQLREDHEEEDRARLDLERRIGDAERLLRDGHGRDPASAVGELMEADSVEDLQRRSETVARRLGLLGRVNLLAVGELGSLQDRHDFLARELDDVKAARHDLQEVIRDVDRRIAELFQSAFDDVAREFADLFATLFPGGEGRLTLTDPDQPLSSGIEVEARPGRKKVKRLSLLSGGERSLAALAFLFAIFRARPSPFYLMDEVEAALDDVNLHRFLEVVRTFAGASQILIVTHQKRTMEMADALYGVSMSRDGASTVISQRMAEVAAR